MFGSDPAGVYFYREEGTTSRIAGGGEFGSWLKGEADGSVYTLLAIGDVLYAGISLRQYGKGSAQVWHFNDNRWVMIEGEGVRESWFHPQVSYLLDLCNHNNTPVALVTRPKTTLYGVGSIFAFAEAEWHTIGRGALPPAMHDAHVHNCALEWRGKLYVATG